MAEPIIYIDRSVVREGKAEEVREGIYRLVEFIEAREPQLISYDFHFDGDRESPRLAFDPVQG